MKYVLPFALVLSGCGGGGGSSTSAPVATTPVPQTVVESPQWADAVTLPSPNEYLPLSSSVFTSMIVPIDLYGDGYTDLVAHYWYNNQDGGVADALVFYNNDRGIWSITNEEVFGSKLVSLGATTRKNAVGDLNGDGIDDIAFAVNLEDGSTGDMEALPAVLLSDNGGLSIQRFGVPDWLHSVDIKDGIVAFTGFNSKGAQAYSYSGNDVWTEEIVMAVDVSGLAFKFIGDRVIDYTDELRLFDGDVLLDTVQFPGRLVPITTWNGVVDDVRLIEYDGEDYIGAGIDTINVNGTSAVARFTGRLIEGGYVDGTDYSETDLPIFTKLIFIDTQYGTLDIQSSPIIGEITDEFYNFYKYSDVNGDSYLDVFVSMSESKAVIYLANFVGDNEIYTGELPDDNGTRSELIDLTNDYIGDIITLTMFSETPTIKIYEGSAQL